MSKKVYERLPLTGVSNQSPVQTKEQLQESINRLQAILDAVPDLLFEVGLDGRIHDYHSPRTDLLAAPPEVFLGKRFSDVLPLDVADVCMSALSEAHEKGHSIGKQYELQLAHGRFWFELSVSRKPVNTGQDPRFIFLARDITQRKQAESQLSGQEEFLRMIAENIDDFIAVLDTKGVRLYNSPSYGRLFGNAESLLYTDSFTEIHPDDREYVKSAFMETVRSGISQCMDFRFVLADGTICNMESRGGVIRDSLGEVFRVVVVSRNVTERKQAEEVLKLHKVVIDTAIDGFWMVDMAGNLREANEAYAGMSGYTVDELLNMHISQLEVKEASVEDVSAHIKKIIAQGSERFETRHRRKDGQEIDVEISTRFMPESQSFFGFLRDITEHKRAERELRELNEHLEERIEQRTRELTQAKQLAESANRIKSEFLANMSHEIRTPMNSILGMAHLALNLETEPKNRDYLKKIQTSGEHLLGIIDDVLDFSRLDAGKLKIDTVDFDLCRMLESVNNLVAGKAAAKGLELVFDTDASLCISLRGDPLRLAQVLVNYADNAIKFTEKGRITIRSKKIKESEASCLVRFEVQDTGIGMSDAESAKLFQPFQQLNTSSTRQYGGTGLGLAICKQLAEMMHGEVGVKSAPGQGSTFWFSVRLDKAWWSCRAENQNGMNVPPAMLATISGTHILLAENNLFNQQVATEFLENAGATVCVAQNGEEAIDLLINDGFDCVLMDIQMPVLDGLETTKLIRANPAFAGIPVIAMTANVSGEDRERCLAAGMNDFISKPFKPYAFYAVIAKCLSVHAQQAPVHGAPAAAATEVTREDDLGTIDFSVLAELVGGDKLKMREFALKFLASARQDMTEVEAALERNDLAALGALGHHIKSPARMAGAIGFADLCQTLEQYGKNGASMEQIQGVVSSMRPLLDRINEQIDKELA